MKYGDTIPYWVLCPRCQLWLRWNGTTHVHLPADSPCSG